MRDIVSGTFNVIEGDATLPDRTVSDCPVILIPHVCNNIGVWGSGFVLAVNRAFGHIPSAEYKNFMMPLINVSHPQTFQSVAYNAKLGDVQFVLGTTVGFGASPDRQERYVVNMIGQDGCGKDGCGVPPIRYDAVASAMQKMVEMTLDKQSKGEWGKVEIHCPKFGCGLAGGDWNIISGLIQNIWVRRGFNVTVYEFKG